MHALKIIFITILALLSQISASWTVPERCLKNFPESMCRAYFEKYGYDQESGSCKMMVWGGCGHESTENTNFFGSMHECEEICLGKM